jgi:glycosyltransferase involved in cell wall biosynthesis
VRIAQVAPLFESVPPKLYGGTERIVAYLTEELVRQGQDVTLFASGDSRTTARLVPCRGTALRLDPSVRDWVPHHLMMLEQVRRRADEFDVVHFHVDLLHFPLFHPLAERTVTTLHGRLDLPDLKPLYREFSDMPLASISWDQRRPMPPVNWVGTVHHGLPATLYPFYPFPEGGYLAFLGRICPEKRPDLAIEIARRAGMRLKIAAKVDRADEAYFREVIQPLLDDPLVEFIGEVGERDKAAFLGNARALLFPIDWPEPFGLVMIEAMACGTPVVALRRGSVPEVIDHGVSGWIVDDADRAVEAVRDLGQLDRREVRRRFEQRFTAERMARDYLAIYTTSPRMAWPGRSNAAPPPALGQPEPLAAGGEGHRGHRVPFHGRARALLLDVGNLVEGRLDLPRGPPDLGPPGAELRRVVRRDQLLAAGPPHVVDHPLAIEAAVQADRDEARLGGHEVRPLEPAFAAACRAPAPASAAGATRRRNARRPSLT